MENLYKKRILLVEDDPDDARRITEQLVNGGGDFYIAKVARLGTALDKLAGHGFDLLLLDLSLPDFPDAGAMDALLQVAPELPIIVLSGAADQTMALEAVKRGAQDHLIKGETPDGVLIRAIHYAIERKQSELKLTQTISALQEANQQILAQQTSKIEEERLKVLLQMAGATAHELNQPIMTLLGTIEIMRMDEPIPNGWENHVARIETAGRRIADIVKKMSSIRNVDHKPYAGGTTIINLDQQIRMLVVEDNDLDYKAFKDQLLQQDHVEVLRATTGSEAMRLLEKKRFNLVFLDDVLPDGRGLDLLRWMAKEKVDVPVIAITGHGDELMAARMIKAGASDYLPRAGINHATLNHCIAKAMEKFRIRKEVEHANQNMVHMATRDALTGLFNRYHMNDALEKEFGRALRYGGDLTCVLFNLDDFREVNETHGHRFGDYVLQQFAQRIKANTREADLCFRYGGDEFMVLLPQAGIATARGIAEQIRLLCEHSRYDDGKGNAVVTVSVGIATVGKPPISSATELMALADKALRQSKAEGRNRVTVYKPSHLLSDSDQRFQHLRERLTVILEKAKHAALEALETMTLDMGGERFKPHNRRVIQYLGMIGAKLNFDPAVIKSMQRAAVLHDFTKVLLGDFYDKAQLTAEERLEIENHPFLMAALIEPFDFFADERTVMLWHHEHYDGSGYPDGLKGDEIPLAARIFNIVDALVAMTSERPHRKSNTAQETIQDLLAHAGTQFDPMLVDIMLDVIKENNLLDLSDKAHPKCAQLRIAME